MFNTYDNVYVVNALPQQKITGSSAVKGTAVDTMGYENAMLYVRVEAATGTPDAATMAVKLQESVDTTDGDFADAKDNTAATIGSTLTVTAAIAEAFYRIEGLGLNRLRYLRAVLTPTYTNGTSPGNISGAYFLMCPRTTAPVRTTVSNT